MTPAAQLRGRLEAVHPGHLAVHQDGGVAAPLHRRERLQPGCRHVDPVSQPFEHLGRHGLIHLIVLDHQHVAPAHGVRRGELVPGDHGLRAAGGHPSQGGEAFPQLFLPSGFHQIGGDTLLPRLTRLPPQACGGEQNDVRGGQGRIIPDHPGQCEAVHARHLHVENGELWRRAPPDLLPQNGQRPRPRLRQQALHAPGGQLLVQHPPVGLVVVHDQRPEVRQAHRGLGQLARFRRLQSGGEPEGAPLPRLADDADLPAHQLDQLLADGESEPGPAEPSRGGRVRLGERLEQPPHGLRGDPQAGVADLEADQRDLVADLDPLHLDNDLSIFRELDGVPGEIDQDLSQPSGVSPRHHRNLRADRADQLQPLGMGPLRHQAGHVLDRIPQIELDAFNIQPPRFDLREVEDVIDDREQGLGGPRGGADEFELLLGERRIAEEIEHADHAVHGCADLVAHRGQEDRLGLGG